MFARAWCLSQRGLATRLQSTWLSQQKQDHKELNDFFPELVETLDREVARSNIHNTDALHELFEYSLGGKLFRACATFNTMRELTGLVSRGETTVSMSLAWSVEMTHAGLLLLDDIADEAATRRGKPCWHIRGGAAAVRDGLFLLHAARRLICVHFKGDPRVDVLNALQNILFEACFGQNFDIHCTKSGHAKFDEFCHQRYRDVVAFKTSYYSFYLPIAVAMYACGDTDCAAHSAARAISLDIGLAFQIQDDYLDCYGSFEETGKQGSDIRNGKCTWLVAEAKRRANPTQLKALKDNYGFDDKKKVDLVIQLYDELNVKDAVIGQEQQCFRGVEEKIKRYSRILPSPLYEYVYAIVRQNTNA